MWGPAGGQQANVFSQPLLADQHLHLNPLADLLARVVRLDSADDLPALDADQPGLGGHPVADPGGRQVCHVDAVSDGVFVGFQIRQDDLAARQLHVAHH